MYKEVVTKLRAEAAKCDYRIKESLENQKKMEKLNNTIASCSMNARRCEESIEGMKPAIKSIQEYLATKAKDGVYAINQALALASDVIPDSMRDVRFCMEGDAAWLEVAGCDLDGIEGSGYKGASSMFIQSTLVKQNPNILQTVVFDEPLAKVSSDNSTAISACLPFLCKDLQVILIEQKKEVYANFDHTEYHFFKDENGTRVEKELVGGQVENN